MEINNLLHVIKDNVKIYLRYLEKHCISSKMVKMDIVDVVNHFRMDINIHVRDVDVIFNIRKVMVYLDIMNDQEVIIVLLIIEDNIKKVDFDVN